MWIRALGIAVAAALLFAGPAAGFTNSAATNTAAAYTGPFAPWDGTNPFNCTIQDVGTGVDFPDPAADPFCVEFDKTQQNVTDFGIVDFLLNEPARTAAASPKCFYFQTDHWTGSVVQGEAPELWHWDGQYFFDKAIGAGGVNITNFRILGQPASFPPGTIPPQFDPYFDQGGGGAYVVTGIPADPKCAARVDTPEERAQIYSGGTAPPSPASSHTLGGAGGATSAFAKSKKKKCRKGHTRRCRKRR